VDVKNDDPITPLIDASLFQDDDGKVYWIYQNGMIARMTDDMSGLAEEPCLLVPADATRVGFDGATLNKGHGKYILTCAALAGPQYHCNNQCVPASESIPPRGRLNRAHLRIVAKWP